VEVVLFGENGVLVVEGVYHNTHCMIVLINIVLPFEYDMFGKHKKGCIIEVSSSH
jgi:hypothetical protein